MKMIVAQNKKVLAMASKMSKAIELEAEEVLLHAEEVIKKFIPARYVKSALTKIEKALEKEGMEVVFDKTVTREALRKTAKQAVEAKEIYEVINQVTAAVVAEIEDVLKDVDEVADETTAKFHNDLRLEAEAKLKSSVERSMASKGIYFKLARVNKPAKVAKVVDKK